MSRKEHFQICFVKINKQSVKQFHHVKEKLWTFYLCYVLYWGHVDVYACTKIIMVILLGPISRCSEYGIWTTQTAAYEVDGENNISGKCSEQLMANSLTLTLYTVIPMAGQSFFLALCPMLWTVPPITKCFHEQKCNLVWTLLIDSVPAIHHTNAASCWSNAIAKIAADWPPWSFQYHSVWLMHTRYNT